jgi:hypothetical protein
LQPEVSRLLAPPGKNNNPVPVDLAKGHQGEKLTPLLQGMTPPIFLRNLIPRFPSLPKAMDDPTPFFPFFNSQKFHLADSFFQKGSIPSDF